jgi:Ca2+-binding RTX toxin-like protein
MISAGLRVGPLVLLLSLMVLWPAYARASSVTSDGHATFTADPGEVNRVRVLATSWGRDDAARPATWFRDRGNRLRAGEGCRSIDRRIAVCLGAKRRAVVRLGDRDDVLRPDANLTAFGGAGDDRLLGYKPDRPYYDEASSPNVFDGGPGDDVLTGGLDRDTLTGGPGRDRVVGRRGADEIIDGETDAQAARDVIDGSHDLEDAFDVVDYSIRTRPLLIGGEDELQDIEHVIGGSGDDKFTGTPADELFEGRGGDDRLDGGGGVDELEGGDGDDTLAGGAGDDLLAGGPGADVLAGGPGDDAVDGGDGLDDARGEAGDDAVTGGAGDDALFGDSGDDRLDGGAGTDGLACGDGADSVTGEGPDTIGGCEALLAFGGYLEATTEPVFSAGAATFRLRCAMCAGTVILTALSGEAFGGASFGFAPGAAAPSSVTVALTEAAVAAVRAGVPVRVRFDQARGGTDGYVILLRGAV